MEFKLRSLLLLPLLAAAPVAADGFDPEVLQRLVEREAATAAMARVAPPDRLEILSVRFGGSDPIRGDISEVELIDIDGPNASGVLRLLFRMLDDGEPVGQARASVRGRVRGPALVARNTLKYGQAVSPRDVEILDTDLSRLSAEPLRNLAEIVGRVPVRTLGAGRTLTRALLRAEPVVRRGETVELKIRKRGLMVVTKGAAKRDGALGDTVPAENLRTGAMVLGQVQSDGSLLVTRGAHRGRQ